MGIRIHVRAQLLLNALELPAAPPGLPPAPPQPDARAFALALRPLHAGAGAVAADSSALALCDAARLRQRQRVPRRDDATAAAVGVDGPRAARGARRAAWGPAHRGPAVLAVRGRGRRQLHDFRHGDVSSVSWDGEDSWVMCLCGYEGMRWDGAAISAG